MFDMTIDWEKLATTSKEFQDMTRDKTIDEALAWIRERDGHVAILRNEEAQKYALMAIENFNYLDDVASAYAYLPHWEMNGFAVDDMPTVQDVFRGADTNYLLTELTTLLKTFYKDMNQENLKAVKRIARHTLCYARDILFTSRINSYRIILPYAAYQEFADDDSIRMKMETREFAAREVRSGEHLVVGHEVDFEAPDILQHKIWLGGLTIRNSYRVLAWILLKLSASELTESDISLVEKDTQEKQAGYLSELLEASRADLGSRAKELSARIVDPEDLELLTVEFEDNVFQKLQESCDKKGLTLQNGIHILLRRFVKDLESADNDEGISIAGIEKSAESNTHRAYEKDA